MFRSQLNEKCLRDKLENQVRPNNWENAKPPRVNSGIWRKLKEHTKKRDVCVFKFQQALDKGIYPVARIIDLTITAKTLNAEQCIKR